jgi:hypothetical protein
VDRGRNGKELWVGGDSSLACSEPVFEGPGEESSSSVAKLLVVEEDALGLFVLFSVGLFFLLRLWGTNPSFFCF